ncbi:MAG: hypothetical protein ACXABY_21170 [Candidatus Thorarchaeota archaeon]
MDEPWVYTYEVEGWVPDGEAEVITLYQAGMFFSPEDDSLNRLNTCMWGEANKPNNTKRTIKVKIEVIDES